jgi:Protein of unknown function (DUF3363)
VGQGLSFRTAMDGEKISGKFAVVEESHEFILVPRPPVFDRQFGGEVVCGVQGGSVSRSRSGRGDLVVNAYWTCESDKY